MCDVTIRIYRHKKHEPQYLSCGSYLFLLYNIHMR